MFNEIANCINGNKMIKDDLIYDMADLFVKTNDLQDYVKEIEMLDEELDDCYASYCKETGTILISKNGIIKAIYLDGYKKNIQSIYTARIINSLYHELVHAIQYKEIKDDNYSLSTLIFEDNLLRRYWNKNLYDEKYNDFSTEINAYIISYLKTKELIDSCAKDNFWKFIAVYEITYYFIDRMKQFYEKSSPVERMNIILPNCYKKEYTNYEKISMGLPIDETTRNKIMKMQYEDAIIFKKYINSK